MVEEFALTSLAGSRRSDTDLVARLTAIGEFLGPLGCLRQLAAQSTRTDRRSDLAAIDCPTLIVSGAEDEVSPVNVRWRLRSSAGSVAELVELRDHVADRV